MVKKIFKALNKKMNSQRIAAAIVVIVCSVNLSLALGIAAGERHTLLIHPTKALLAFGEYANVLLLFSHFALHSNSYGQLGTGYASSFVPYPVKVHFGAMAGKQIIDIAAGAEHSVFLTSDGLLYTVGSNAYGLC